MLCSVLVRRLKEGASFEDFRQEWVPTQAYGLPARIVQARRIDDDREVVTIVLVDADDEGIADLHARITQGEEQRLERIAEFVESTVSAGVYQVVEEFDLS